MIIGVSGYGATGASAVLGLIEECDNIQSYRYGSEFQILQQPDGILDLHHYIVEDGRRLSISTAISRYKKNLNNTVYRNMQKVTNNNFYSLSKNYINSLIQISWKGRSEYETVDQQHFIDHSKFRMIRGGIYKIINKISPKFPWPPNTERYFSSVDENNFNIITKKYLKDILSSSGFDLKGNILLEQLFPPTNPAKGMEYFDDAVSIIVERDPRDLYVLTNYLMPHLSRFMPNSGNVNSFICYYKGLHRRKSMDSRVRYVQYEDFIYKYEEITKELLDWLGLKNKMKRTIFIPEQSINNTCLYKNYPELESKIRQIEENLTEYLYPFDELNSQHVYKRDINSAFVLKPGDTIIKK